MRRVLAVAAAATAVVGIPWLFAMSPPGHHYDKICTKPSRKPLEVIDRRRPTNKELEELSKAEDKRMKARTKCFWLPKHLTASGRYCDTWPQPLRLFSYNVANKWSRYTPTVPEIITILRKYYPEDEVLMHFANFLESAIKEDPNVTFSQEYKHTLIHDILMVHSAFGKSSLKRFKHVSVASSS